MTTTLTLTCRDPIVARDGRPFGRNQGTRMRSLTWPTPSLVAGSLRSTLGKRLDPTFAPSTIAALLELESAGVFPAIGDELYLPAPQDCVVQDGRTIRAQPDRTICGGCDLPTRLSPIAVAPDQAAGKPQQVPAWWPATDLARWLTGDTVTLDDRFLADPVIDVRTHVKIDDVRGAANDGELFSTAALPLDRLPQYHHGPPTFADITLALRARGNAQTQGALAALDALHPLGGERRLAHWRATTSADMWRCPKLVDDALTSATRVRMALATPAVFAGGWKPGWLNDDLVGKPPSSTVELRLVGLAIRRWQAISGWSLAGPRPGPKPIKRVVPAGGVYFFEITDGTAQDLAARWLEPVSDDLQDRRDGFGLALWGTW